MNLTNALPCLSRTALSLWMLGALACGVGTVSTESTPRPDAGHVTPAHDAGTVVPPAIELCGNGLDDDHDGQIDEDCGCSAGATRSCFSGTPSLAGVGQCRAGHQTCAAQGELNTSWGPCTGEVLPTAEACNGLDDDCDGQIDEALQNACATSCGGGVEVCTNGVWAGCNAKQPTVEICNGVDDDCDGQIDESTDRACSSACGAGVEACVNGHYAACTARQPTIEICNGIDDDCDGQIDEFTDRACSSACGAGVEACVNGAFAACTARQPTVEVCNGIDDDCDGLIDEGLQRACSTACGAGVEVCSAGAYGMCSARQPIPEICGNGIDDDCDGQVDEGCFCIQSPGATPWQIHTGEAPMCFGLTFATNGNIGEYAYSTIPGANDPGWMPHNAPAISFDDPSAMCGVCNCRAGGDFTYFQTSFNIPAGFTVTSLTVNIADVDDGVRVTIFNATYPNGAVNAGSYAFLGGGSTSNLAALVAPGPNRLVLTHVDDCCSVRRIANATVSLNGSAINPCP